MRRTERVHIAPLALTLGDPAGIGPEITVKAWHEMSRLEGAPDFLVLGDPDVLVRAGSAVGLPARVELVASFDEAREIFTEALPVMPIALAVEAKAGAPDARNADAIIRSIEHATTAVFDGHASAVVTNPIAKHVLRSAGFAHPGHTEFLAELAARRMPGKSWRPVMMLAGPELRVVPLTIHVPLSAVPGLVTTDAIVATALIMLDALRRDFAIASPRLAIAGLNPHAGEAGTIGTEDRDIVAPAVAQLAVAGHAVTGPHSADTLFHAQARTQYDGALCMYHDQALIPLKTLAFDDGVNVTLGLPFVRTSPDHGTAFDIAGSGRARATSLIAAIGLAAEMAARRKRYELGADPSRANEAGPS